MLMIFAYDRHGILTSHKVGSGKTIDGKYYEEYIKTNKQKKKKKKKKNKKKKKKKKQLRQAIRRKRPELLAARPNNSA